MSALRHPLAAALPLLVLLLLSMCATTAHAAKKPQALACKAGHVQVRLAAKLRCVKPLAGAKATTPSALLARAVVTPRELAAALPPRLRARLPLAKLRRVDRALTRHARTAFATPARSRVRARAAAASDCGGPAGTSVDGVTATVDGVEVTGSGGRWGRSGGPTTGTEKIVDARLGNGASKRQRTKECVSWDVCPAGDGTVSGHYAWVYEEITAVAAGNAKASIRVTMEITATLTGHVGGDGRIKSFDADAVGTAVSRAEGRQDGKVVKHVPGSTIRTAVTIRGADPRQRGKTPTDPTYRAWGTGGSVLNGDSASNMDMMRALVVAQGVALPRTVSAPLLAAEQHWYDDAACLDVVFDPQPADATPNARIPVAVAVKAKDGAAVVASYDATPVDGAVGPPTGTTPATVTWTAPAQLDEGTFPTFKVVAVSSRGRALGTHTARGPQKGKWWKVTYTGAGEYHRYEPRGIPYPQLWVDATYNYKMVTQPVRIPYVDAHPEQELRTSSESVAVTGELKAKRVDGGGTDTCASAPDNAGLVGWVDVAGGGDGFDLSVVPLQLLHAPPMNECALGDDLLITAEGFENGMRADTHVSRADLERRDRIELAVNSGASPLTADCQSDARPWACTHSVSWSGTIVLERVPTPPGERP